jgi:predicted PurR-regulated permease PerM
VINITAVDLWVKGSDELDEEADEWALTMPLMVLAFFSVLMMRTAHKDQTSPFYVSILVAAALMYVVNRMRRHLSADFLRMSSDLILLIAALFFFLIH